MTSVKVRLVKKLAEVIDGIDVSGNRVGDVLDLPAEQARLLIAEEWAITERRYRSSPTRWRRRSDDHAVQRGRRTP